MDNAIPDTARALSEPLEQQKPTHVRNDEPTTVESNVITTKPLKASSAKKKKPKKSTKTHPEWMGVTTISKTYALTIPKVKKELIRHGYMDVDGQPTKKALTQNVVQSKEIEDTFNGTGGLVLYHRWSGKKMSKIFKPATEVDLFCHVRSRYTLERKVCQLFERAGAALGIDYDDYSPESAHDIGLTLQAYHACIESNVHDPHFLGGPGTFVFTRTYKEAHHLISTRIEPLSEGIHSALLAVNPSEAEFFKEALDRLMDWFWKQCS